MLNEQQPRRMKDEKEWRRTKNKKKKNWQRDFSAERLTHSRCLIYFSSFFPECQCGAAAPTAACRFYFYHFKHKINIYNNFSFVNFPVPCKRRAHGVCVCSTVLVISLSFVLDVRAHMLGRQMVQRSKHTPSINWFPFCFDQICSCRRCNFKKKII